MKMSSSGILGLFIRTWNMIFVDISKSDSKELGTAFTLLYSPAKYLYSQVLLIII